LGFLPSFPRAFKVNHRFNRRTRRVEVMAFADCRFDNGLSRRIDIGIPLQQVVAC
jgi:hypothetical protein